MTEEVINLSVLWKRFAGDNLKLFFGSVENGATKVLILKNIVAFIETEFSSVNTYILQVKEGKSVYGLDMSFRFKKPEYQDYYEVFLFVDKPGQDIALRALAREVVWCDLKDLSQDDLNY